MPSARPDARTSDAVGTWSAAGCTGRRATQHGRSRVGLDQRLDDLGDLRPGQVVRVVTPRGAMVYRTTRVVTLSKAELAARSQDLFGQERNRTRLVLITCTDWNGSDFESNVVAFARPLGVRQR